VPLGRQGKPVQMGDVQAIQPDALLTRRKK
jgi:hypothetical protein